ncbi:BON domain-containing protein [Hymenobacter sp. 15J16-1T3B]|uniref:BON domain-containing protein n=1 Tax=Hymenobacter sp. 15J16-1T3B TaxID=2886941 RepID=UPI001D12BF1C|nr:BON domain-containing protein [Hymenobacter sp. 15J16-1T3B]MCC3156680.1 BON domain-containing protein [Hymenobacter sp. 15J16-1T3B]
MLRSDLAPPEERVADQNITRAVELLFLTCKGVTSQQLDVETHEGIVQLAGCTDNLLARERAEAIAKEVRGVRGVVNAIEVRTQPVPDAVLLRSVQQALHDNAATADYPVHCRVQQGEVTVEGTVHSWAEQQLVLQVLRGVRGVRQIHPRLQLHPQPEAAPVHLVARLRTLLAWDLRLKSDLVSIEPVGHGVRVSGQVGSLAEREQLLHLAYAAGAAHIDASGLTVAAWALDPHLRPPRAVPQADGAIEQAVRDALRLDPRVAPFVATLQVNVRQGQVTLFGTVGHLQAHHAAAQDAGNVVGVVGVENHLLVRSHYLASDDETRQRVAAALARDAYVGRCAFAVSVHDGHVRLAGEVASPADQIRAGEVAAGIRGVAAVDNRVQVAPAAPAAPPEPDAELAQRLHTHFYWSAPLHDQDIDVQVRHGCVTLSGTVDTRLTRERATEEALLCGAREVHNHLRLAGAP